MFRTAKCAFFSAAFHLGKFWKCKLDSRQNYRRQDISRDKPLFNSCFWKEVWENHCWSLFPGICFFLNDLFLPKYPNYNPKSLCADRYICSKVTWQIIWGKESERWACNRNNLSCFLFGFVLFSSRPFSFSCWLIILTGIWEKKENFFKWSKNTLIFLIENSVCFLQTSCPQVEEAGTIGFARGKLTFFQNSARQWATSWQLCEQRRPTIPIHPGQGFFPRRWNFIARIEVILG